MRYLLLLVLFLPYIAFAQISETPDPMLDSLKRLIALQEQEIALAEMPIRKMPPTEIVWEEVILDFGEIREDSIWVGEFRFQNVGTQPFVLLNVKPSCGCTVVDWSEKPLLPQEQGTVKVSFNAKNQSGHRKKSMTLTGNFTEGIRKMIYFEGEVIPTEF